ncbi:MAG: mechanosensitive ion channel family protein [Clostridia bacterium]|nr:mechanosensitive ion channel family protein [Clostridia bacterium]
MENFKNYTAQFFSNKLIQSLIVIIVSFLIYHLIKHFLLGKKTLNNKMNKKSKTYVKMLVSILRYTFIIVTSLVILQINGIDVSSMLAGVGIVSVIVGLAIQDALKDIIRGISILSDDYFKVGDVVQYGDVEAKVLELGLKTTKIKDIRTLNIISISNRNIEQIQVVSHSNDIVIPFPYETDIEKADTIISDIIEDIKKLEKIEDSFSKGICELAPSSLNYMINITCKPEDKPQTIRDALKLIVIGLRKHNIEIPFQQIDIHTK